jgi:hypothetical protein
MILTTSEISVYARATESFATTFEQIDVFTEKARKCYCRLVYFTEGNPGGFIVKFMGTKENLDRLLGRLGCFDGCGEVMVYDDGTYTLRKFNV